MRFLLLALLGVSSLALAHPGHEYSHSALLAGLLHPLSGLDHLTMGLGLGILLARTFKQARFMGLALLLVTLTGGFILGMAHMVPVSIAEYGIVASLVVLAVALWQRSTSVFLATTALLGVFHGLAHGAELGTGMNPLNFMLGMLVTLGVLYSVGLLAGQLIKRHIKQGERIVAVLIGVVALLGLT